MKRLTALCFMILCLTLSLGSANATHLQGYVYCDENQNQSADWFEKIAGVTVIVVNEAGTFLLQQQPIPAAIIRYGLR